MTTEQCGVFATVIPVLWLAGSFSRDALKRAASGDFGRWILLVVGSWTALCVAVALVGAMYNGLPGWLAGFVLGGALAELVAVVLMAAMETGVFHQVDEARAELARLARDLDIPRQGAEIVDDSDQDCDTDQDGEAETQQ